MCHNLLIPHELISEFQIKNNELLFLRRSGLTKDDYIVLFDLNNMCTQNSFMYINKYKILL